MKKNQLSVLEFKKHSIVNLNSNQMLRVYGGTGNLGQSIADIVDVDTNPYTQDNTGNGGGDDDTKSTNGGATQTGPMSTFSKYCPPPPPDSLNF